MELLVVMGIIAVLAALLMPVLSAMRDKYLATKCVSNMRQIGGAMSLYRADHNMMLLPSPGTFASVPNFWYRDWMYSYAPYIKPTFNRTVDWNMPVFWCPAFKATGGNGGPAGPPKVADWRIQSTSYWYGDFAAGDQKHQPPVPFPADENMTDRHILRELSWFHENGTRMNLLYGDGHVASYLITAPFPPP